ncbi:MAG: hypothetical protein D6780_04385, partial [Candidatus Dadabacteria bacterium]
MKRKIVNFLTLFTSAGTLLCCALPVTIAAVAGAASVGSLITVFPWLVPLSLHKKWIFITAGILLLISGYMTFSRRSQN